MTSSTDAKRVLFIGQQPETVDFSDPALPPGFDAAKIHAGIAIGMQQMADRGWAADLCLVPPDASATDMVKQRLASTWSTSCSQASMSHATPCSILTSH